MGRWLVAARPATLWAALTPVVVGSALAEADDSLRPGAFLAALVVSVAMQVGVNIANDVADAARGADSEARVGPPPAVASGLITPRQAWYGVAASFAVAGAAGLYLLAIAGWVVALIGVTAVMAALAYTSGPAYGYHGLGEMFVFLYFGLAATIGSRYVHDRTAPADAWVLAVAVGLLITAILVANNLRDIDTDAAAGKRTLAVRIGRGPTRRLYAATLGGAAVAVVVGVAAGAVAGGALLGLVVAPAAIPLIRTTFTTDIAAELIQVLAGTSHLQAAWGFATAVGIIWLG